MNNVISKADKQLWQWLTPSVSNGVRSISQARSSVLSCNANPGVVGRVWGWLFEKRGSSYIRAERGLIAIRNRSKQYGLAGWPVQLCADQAIIDIGEHVVRPTVMSPPPRRR